MTRKLLLFLSGMVPWVVGASEAGSHGGVSQKALVLTNICGIPVTNSMLVTGLIVLGIVIVVQLATRKMALVPGKLQNFVEWTVESLYNFLESIMGKALTKRTFWFFASLFLFILIANWSGLLPGFGTIGWGHAEGMHFKVTTPLLRGPDADFNMTFGLAMLYFGLWMVWALQSQGPWGVIKHTFGPKGEVSGIFGIFLTLIFICAGVLELVSILFRPISLSLRLFGNIYAGENMLHVMMKMVPALDWLLPIPFYFMEVLVGLVQALVFMLLAAVFTLLICSHDESEHASSGSH
jgi:F-type H+-transporting ATPase subunit a